MKYLRGLDWPSVLMKNAHAMLWQVLNLMSRNTPMTEFDKELEQVQWHEFGMLQAFLQVN